MNIDLSLDRIKAMLLLADFAAGLCKPKPEIHAIHAVLWTGGNPSDRNATLTVTNTEGPTNMRFCAFWEPGYCGCDDCHGKIILGYGATEPEAIQDYWEKWKEAQDDDPEEGGSLSPAGYIG